MINPSCGDLSLSVCVHQIPFLVPVGHTQSITALAIWINPSLPSSSSAAAKAEADDEALDEPAGLICSGSRDLLTLVQMDHELMSIEGSLWEFTPSKPPSCISFDPSGYLLCLGVGKTVIVLRAR